MTLLQLKIDPLEVRAMRTALEKIVVLLEAKLLADGYLQEPYQPKLTTAADVSVPTPESIWETLEKQRKAERQKEQLGETPKEQGLLNYIREKQKEAGTFQINNLPEENPLMASSFQSLNPFDPLAE